MLLEGVDAFSTDPDVDQRATAELRARLDEYTPPEQRTRRNSQKFDSAEHLFELHVVKCAKARMEARRHGMPHHSSNQERKKEERTKKERKVPFRRAYL